MTSEEIIKDGDEIINFKKLMYIFNFMVVLGEIFKGCNLKYLFILNIIDAYFLWI